MSRITLTTVMTGPIEGLNRVIKEFLAANDIGCILQTTIIEFGYSTTFLTMLTMEGEKEKLIATRDLLVLDLNGKFSGIKYDTWDQNESDNPWPIATTIKPTSGYVDEKIAETFFDKRIIKAAKDMGGRIIMPVNHAKPLLVQAAQTAGEIKQVYSRASSLKDGLVKNADFSYQNRTLLLNTQPCLDWTLLMLEVKKVFEIAEQSAVNIYKKLDDGTLSQIIDISGIEAKERYYVQTDADALKKGSNLASTMEQFFERLKTDEDMSDAQVEIAKEAFSSQGITYKQLMKTGDLAITDGALERIGISQFGLRTAILAMKDTIEYQSGFGRHFETEAIPDALPKGRNNPQKVAFGLYAEQLSGTAFTAPRCENQKCWLYRIRPSVCHSPFTTMSTMSTTTTKTTHANTHTRLTRSFGPNDGECECTPNQLRWSPFTAPSGPDLDWPESLTTICGAGDPSTRSGLAIHIYTCAKSMPNRAFTNSDGDFLVVLQQGSLEFETEMGVIRAAPGEIVVIPRGIRVSVHLLGLEAGTFARGYVLEVLANPRDFMYPVAAYKDIDGTSYQILNKYQSHLFVATQTHCPFDVVAWHGNYAPYKYDLSRFNTINTVSYDHPDPSIFTVLTVKSGQPGTALADFVIFPPRWMVAEDTFRPPWFHRNCMSEFMGLVSGAYDAKNDGFVPGGASLHSIGTPHGPDADVFEKASNEELGPVKMRPDGLAFMFESNLMMSVTKWALGKQVNGIEGCTTLQPDYYKCWQGMKKHFKPPQLSK